jgi:hypothetical protein
MHLSVHIWIILQGRKLGLDVVMFGVTNLSDATEAKKNNKSSTTSVNHHANEYLNLRQNNGGSTKIITSLVATIPENHVKFLKLDGLGGKPMNDIWHKVNVWSRCDAPVRMHETFPCHTLFVICLEGALDY